MHCGNAHCSSGNTKTTVDNSGNVGYDNSIAIGADGMPIISTYEFGTALQVVHCTAVDCSSSDAPRPVDSSADVGKYSSITIGADGLPVISYQDFSNGTLKVLHCGSLDCSSGNTSTTVDASPFAGAFTSITIGADGLPLISSFEGGDVDNLKVLHCANTFCVPYFRRR